MARNPLSDESITSITSKLPDKKYNLISFFLANIINFDGDKKFWSNAFRETRTPAEIEDLKRYTMKTQIVDLYHFFLKFKEQYPNENKEFDQIAKTFREIQDGVASLEDYLLNLFKGVSMGIVSVLYEIWAGKFANDRAEFEAMMERVYDRKYKLTD